MVISVIRKPFSIEKTKFDVLISYYLGSVLNYILSIWYVDRGPVCMQHTQ